MKKLIFLGLSMIFSICFASQHNKHSGQKSSSSKSNTYTSHMDNSNLIFGLASMPFYDPATRERTLNSPTYHSRKKSENS